MPKHTLSVTKTLTDYDRDTLKIELEVETDTHYVHVTRNYSTRNDLTFDLYLEDTTIVDRNAEKRIECLNTDKPTKDGNPDPKTILGSLWDALRQKISEIAPDQISCEVIDEELEVDTCYPDDSAPTSFDEVELCY